MKLIVDIDDELVETAKFAVHLDMGSDYVKSIANGIPLDKIRAELINRYPKNYAGELDLGGSACHFSLNEILEIIDKYRNEVSE